MWVVDAMSEEIQKEELRNTYHKVWILLTLILTPFTAWLFVTMGVLLIDPVLAIIDGLFVAIVYIGYITCKNNLRFKAQKSAPMAESVSNL